MTEESQRYRTAFRESEARLIERDNQYLALKDEAERLRKAPDFANPHLVTKFGSWFRVQVEFYDFLFREATKLCPADWKKKTLEEVSAGFADGQEIYERSVKIIEAAFPNVADAWARFVAEEQ